MIRIYRTRIGAARCYFPSRTVAQNGPIVVSTTVQQLSAFKPYESQILSAVRNWAGERLTSYNLGSVADGDIQQFNGQFKSFWNKTPANYDKKGTNPKYKRSDSSECDFYFRPVDEDIGSIDELLRGAVDQMHLKTAEPAGAVSGRWCFCEITESPKHLYMKLYQLERAVYFLTRNNPKFDIAGCVILINGAEDEAERAMQSFSMPVDCELRRANIPLYIGWVPVRNVYRALSNIEADVAALKTDVAALKTDVAALKTDVAALKTDVAALKTDVAALKTDVAALKTDM